MNKKLTESSNIKKIILLPVDAYSVFEKLMDLQLISADDKEEWQRIIGMRNAIVHDYLNLDERVIKAISNFS